MSTKCLVPMKQCIRLYLAVVLFLNSGLSSADPINWTGAFDNSWGNESNWDVRLPRIDDEALIENDADVIVAGNHEIYSLGLGTNSSLTIASTGSLTTWDWGSNYQVNGRITNAGNLIGTYLGTGELVNTGVAAVEDIALNAISNSDQIIANYIYDAAIQNEGYISASGLYGSRLVNSGEVGAQDIFVDGRGQGSSLLLENNGSLYAHNLEVSRDMSNSGYISTSYTSADVILNSGFFDVAGNTEAGTIINEVSGEFISSSISAGNIVNRGTLATYGIYYDTDLENSGFADMDEFHGTINNSGEARIRLGEITGGINEGTIELLSNSRYFWIRELTNNGSIEGRNADILTSSGFVNNGDLRVRELVNIENGTSIGGLLEVEILDGSSDLEVTASVQNIEAALGRVTFDGEVFGDFDVVDTYGNSDISFGQDNTLNLLLASDTINVFGETSRLTLAGTLKLLLDDVILSIQVGDIFDLIRSDTEIYGDFAQIVHTGPSGIEFNGFKFFENGHWIYRLETIASVTEPPTLALVLFALLVGVRNWRRKRFV